MWQPYRVVHRRNWVLGVLGVLTVAVVVVSWFVYDSMSSGDSKLPCEGVRKERADQFVADVERYAMQVGAVSTTGCSAYGEQFIHASLSGLSRGDLAVPLDGVHVVFAESAGQACAISSHGWQLRAGRLSTGLFFLLIQGQNSPIATCPPQ
ncbi:MAG: hypothetical protein ABMA25_08745 [Ilumatobacteraceae bacterium]